MFAGFQNVAGLVGSLNTTLVPTKAAFYSLVSALPLYQLHAYQITAGISETIGLPATRRFMLLAFRASATVGILLAFPQDAEAKIYKSYTITEGVWSDWISTIVT